MKQINGLTDEQVIESRRKYGDNGIGGYKKNSFFLNIFINNTESFDVKILKDSLNKVIQVEVDGNYDLPDSLMNKKRTRYNARKIINLQFFILHPFSNLFQNQFT